MSVPHSSGERAPDRDVTVLESDLPLSRSLIWPLQREFYAQRGLKAWSEDKVPSFITSNPFIAEIYARIVAAFLADCAGIDRLSAGNPLHVVELGSGTGKFAYLFLRHLGRLLLAEGLDLEFSQGPPALEWHTPHCLSLMVNFDAMAKHFESIGGAALVPGKHSASLNICAFLQGRPGDRFAVTESAYDDAQEAIGPEDLFTLLAWLNAHMEEMTVPQILATLRLTRWDPVALMRLFPVLGRQLRTVGREREDLRDAVLRTLANHYPVSPDENVLAFQCGVILLELHYFAEAMIMLQASQKVLGPSAATSYNLGLCAQGLGRRDEALAFMVEACGLDPNFEPARAARGRLENEAARPATRKPEGL